MFICHLVSVPTGAQTLMRDVFRQMPDTLLPMLTTNGRLDLIDFSEAGMRAVVSSKLPGDDCELLCLTADSLSLRTSGAQLLQLRIVSTQALYDSLPQVLRLTRTYLFPADSLQESVTAYYTLRWRPLPQLAPADMPPAAPTPLLPARLDAAVLRQMDGD